MSKRKNKEVNELIFSVVANKRNLENTLNEYTIRLLTERNELHKKLLKFKKDENKYKDYKQLFKEYNRINHTISSLGFKEFVYNDVIISPTAFLKLAKAHTRVKVSLFNKQHKYKHKQVNFNPVSTVITTEDLIKENNEIIQRFYTFEDSQLPKIFEDFQRYKIIQAMLAKRNVRYKKFVINDNSYPRIVQLLGNKCNECGSRYRLSLHHIIPKSKGGSHDILNLQLLCRKCHDGKHNMINSTNSVIILNEIEAN